MFLRFSPPLTRGGREEVIFEIPKKVCNSNQIYRRITPPQHTTTASDASKPATQHHFRNARTKRYAGR